LLIVFAGLAIPLLAIATPIIIVWLIVRAVGGRPGRDRKTEANEARIMQEMHHGLAGMEKRITNLETIILEQRRRAEQTETTS